MDIQGRFEQARLRVLGDLPTQTGIGTLGEKTVHKVLKCFFEPNEENHEVECLGSVADIKNGDDITEVQTGSLAVLLPKLERFLPHYKVQLVHPVCGEYRLKWIDEDGVLTEGRTVRHSEIYSLGYELYSLRSLLTHPNLTLTVPILRLDDYRRRTRKARGSRVDRIPTGILDIVSFSCKEDYLCLLPDTLGDSFLAKDFNKAIKSRSRYDYYCLRLLVELGLLGRERKGSSYTYYRIKDCINE